MRVSTCQEPQTLDISTNHQALSTSPLNKSSQTPKYKPPSSRPWPSPHTLQSTKPPSSQQPKRPSRRTSPPRSLCRDLACSWRCRASSELALAWRLWCLASARCGGELLPRGGLRRVIGWWRRGGNGVEGLGWCRLCRHRELALKLTERKLCSHGNLRSCEGYPKNRQHW